MEGNNEKSFVVISGAIRERVGGMMLGGYVAEPYLYRAGDLGLIHPSLVSFWKDFKNLFGHENGRSMKCFSAAYSGGLGTYVYEEEDIPVLLYNGHLLACGSPPHLQEKREYIIVPLHKNEFVNIGGTRFGEVKEELLNFYKEKKMRVFCRPANLSPEKALERTIQEQWGRLSRFNPKPDAIYDIPIETSERKIPESRIREMENLKKRLDKLEGWRIDSLDSNIIIGALLSPA